MLMFEYILITLISYTIGLSHCSQAGTTKDKQCPPWSLYDVPSKLCVCHDSQIGDTARVLCTTEATLLYYSYCMTYDKESDTILTSYFPYREVELRNISLHFSAHQCCCT